MEPESATTTLTAPRLEAFSHALAARGFDVERIARDGRLVAVQENGRPDDGMNRMHRMNGPVE